MNKTLLLCSVAFAALLLPGLAPAQTLTDPAVTRASGLLGRWAPDCAAPPHDDNIHVKFGLSGTDTTRTIHGSGAKRFEVVSQVLVGAGVVTMVLPRPDTQSEIRTTLRLQTVVRNGAVFDTMRTVDSIPYRDGQPGRPIISDGQIIRKGAGAVVLFRCTGAGRDMPS